MDFFFGTAGARETHFAGVVARDFFFLGSSAMAVALPKTARTCTAKKTPALWTGSLHGSMEQLFVYLTNLSSGIAYWIIFGILLLCGLGFPLPEDVPLIAAGYLVFDQTLLWVPTVAITLLGVIVGDSILFLLGRKMGMRLLNQRHIQTIFKPEKVRRTRAYFRKYGDKLVFFARFFAGFRAVAFFMAGAMRMRYTRFVLLDGLAACLSVPIWVALGYGLGHYFGDEISQILKSMKEVKLVVSGIALTAVAIFVIRTVIKVRKGRSEMASKPARKRRS